MELNKFKNQLYDDLVQLIEESRAFVANTANKTITLMYWKIGHRIYIYFINNHRAEYGKQFVSQAATKLSWSHFIELLSLKEEIKRDFYSPKID